MLYCLNLGKENKIYLSIDIFKEKNAIYLELLYKKYGKDFSGQGK
jgi:hypothetical protein